MESKKFSWLRYLVIGMSIFVLEYIYLDIIIHSWYSRYKMKRELKLVKDSSKEKKGKSILKYSLNPWFLIIIHNQNKKKKFFSLAEYEYKYKFLYEKGKKIIREEGLDL